MIPNTNPLTGIPYGVIYLNELDQDVAYELMYGMQATDHAYQTACKSTIVSCFGMQTVTKT